MVWARGRSIHSSRRKWYWIDIRIFDATTKCIRILIRLEYCFQMFFSTRDRILVTNRKLSILVTWKFYFCDFSRRRYTSMKCYLFFNTERIVDLSKSFLRHVHFWYFSTPQVKLPYLVIKHYSHHFSVLKHGIHSSMKKTVRNMYVGWKFYVIFRKWVELILGKHLTSK